ncbi:MAG: hypothetical protein JRF02_08215, partial [Deltaproteobacteria bacterium]|nr:hypothetical protein [Deltaproteobacteria bacterium]
MDITSQYPTELLELLADTIPLLCRSEEDILLFFREAGVGYELLSDLWLRVEQVDDSVQKDEIVSTILTRLNEPGDVALQQRKAILEMVTKFINFSHCLPDDQLKALELVSEIRRLLGIKDDLTKVHLELEWEFKKQQKQHQTPYGEKNILDGRKKRDGKIDTKNAETAPPSRQRPVTIKKTRKGPPEAEKILVGKEEILDQYVAELKKRSRGRAVMKLRRLLDLQRAYPQEAFIGAVSKAAKYGLYD